MNEKPDQLPSERSDSEAEARRLTSRRRFTRAGLSAPVVLGSLVSKPVLGQSGPPYNCTVSGQISGNLSRPGDVDCSTLGSSRTFWINNGWPAGGPVKGTLPNNGCQFNNGAVKGDLFNGFGNAVVSGGLADSFFYRNGTCELVTSGPGSISPASLFQVLASTPQGEIYDLGRATVVSLLNYYANLQMYPVTPRMIIVMYNSTYAGGSYPINSTQSWNRKQVLTYLTSLYPAG